MSDDDLSETQLLTRSGTRTSEDEVISFYPAAFLQERLRLRSLDCATRPVLSTAESMDLGSRNYPPPCHGLRSLNLWVVNAGVKMQRVAGAKMHQ